MEILKTFEVEKPYATFKILGFPHGFVIPPSRSICDYARKLYESCDIIGLEGSTGFYTKFIWRKILGDTWKSNYFFCDFPDYAYSEVVTKYLGETVVFGTAQNLLIPIMPLLYVNPKTGLRNPYFAEEREFEILRPESNIIEVIKSRITSGMLSKEIILILTKVRSAWMADELDRMALKYEGKKIGFLGGSLHRQEVAHFLIADEYRKEYLKSYMKELLPKSYEKAEKQGRL